MVIDISIIGGGGGVVIDVSIFGAFEPKPLLCKIKLKVALRKLPFVTRFIALPHQSWSDWSCFPFKKLFLEENMSILV